MSCLRRFNTSCNFSQKENRLGEMPWAAWGRVFYTKKDLLDAIEARQIRKGDVVVLPFQGPLGAPGMPEMLTPTDAINGAGYKKVALITDGRFSSATTGPCIGHVEMEAFNGGTYRGYTGW